LKLNQKPQRIISTVKTPKLEVDIQIRGSGDITVVLELSSCQPVKKRLTHDPMIPGTGEEYPEGRGHIRDEYIQFHRGHSRDKRGRNRRDYNPFHIHSDTEPKTKDRDRDHISSKTEVEIESKMGEC
jgi:hypothetical protein